MKKSIILRNNQKFLKAIIWMVALMFIYRCPFKLVTGIDCPACGISRAFISALKGDFITAFSYHPLFVILGIETTYYILVYAFEFKKIKLNNKIEMFIIIITSLLLILIWIIKICF